MWGSVSQSVNQSVSQSPKLPPRNDERSKREKNFPTIDLMFPTHPKGSSTSYKGRMTTLLMYKPGTRARAERRTYHPILLPLCAHSIHPTPPSLFSGAIGRMKGMCIWYSWVEPPTAISPRWHVCSADCRGSRLFHAWIIFSVAPAAVYHRQDSRTHNSPASNHRRTVLRSWNSVLALDYGLAKDRTIRSSKRSRFHMFTSQARVSIYT